MPAITRDEAVLKLSQALHQMHSDDLAEVYNELFPHAPITEDEAQEQRDQLLRQIKDHVDRGLEVEEIVDLWNVVFPKDRNVYYDEETQTLHYNEESEFLQYAD